MRLTVILATSVLVICLLMLSYALGRHRALRWCTRVGFNVHTNSEMQPRAPFPVDSYFDGQGHLRLPDGSIQDGTWIEGPFTEKETNCTRSYNPATDVGGELCGPFQGKAPAVTFDSNVQDSGQISINPCEPCPGGVIFQTRPRPDCLPTKAEPPAGKIR